MTLDIETIQKIATLGAEVSAMKDAMKAGFESLRAEIEKGIQANEAWKASHDVSDRERALDLYEKIRAQRADHASLETRVALMEKREERILGVEMDVKGIRSDIQGLRDKPKDEALARQEGLKKQVATILVSVLATGGIGLVLNLLMQSIQNGGVK